MLSHQFLVGQLVHLKEKIQLEAEAFDPSVLGPPSAILNRGPEWLSFSKSEPKVKLN